MTYLESTNAYNFLYFRLNGATKATIRSGFDNLYFNSVTGLVFQAGSSDVASLTTGGLLVTASGAKTGYGTGAGGTVTQATSKSTGVTLNKACGRITLNGAALAASTSVSFTLTNSVIEAGDVVVVNIGTAGAANSYVVQVDAVAAGSCRIQLRNISAGSLSEAVVLNFAVIKAVTA